MVKIAKKIKQLLPRILLISGGIILIFIILFGGIKTNDYIQVNKMVKNSDWLAKNGMHEEAYESLILTQSRWTTTKVKKEIEAKIVVERQAMADKDYYITGGLAFTKSMWQGAIDSYLKISTISPYYKEAQDKIKECQTKIDEANTQAEKDKQAEAQKTSQASAKATVANDPFPVHPGFGECDGLKPAPTAPGENIQIDLEYTQCTWSINNKYAAAREEWYARHGQTSPESQTTRTTCKWNYSWCPGSFGCEWVCTSN